LQTQLGARRRLEGVRICTQFPFLEKLGADPATGMGDSRRVAVAGDAAVTADDAEDVGKRLSAWLASELGPDADVRIEGLHRTSSGFSRENWVFDASWLDDGRRVSEPLIARRDPVGSVLETDRAVEFGLLHALEGSALPTPRVRWLDADGRWLERPTIVMRREEGECDWFVLNGSRPLATRLSLAEQFCDVLIAIHQLDWRQLGLADVLGNPDPDPALAALDQWESQLRRCQREPFPELEVVLAWLRAHAPTDGHRPVLVHADFKPGNALLQGDRVAFMLDWELAHLGDPVEDLGWITNPVRRREHQIPGVWERQQLIARYQQATGITVSEEALRWWNVLANFKLSVIVLTGLAAFVEGRYDRSFQIPLGLFSVMFDLIGA
jgi:aminoglycoside phosphotransferase (APT) family kinase protein